MKSPLILGAGLLGGLLSLSIGWSSTQTPQTRQPVPTLAAAGGGTIQFDVTVTNLSRGQVLSPLIAATHDATASIFTLGQPASSELVLLAEDGDAAPLAGLLMNAPGVLDVQLGTGPVPPGGSATLRVTAGSEQRLLSLASMLVNTNDAFVALDAAILPLGGQMQRFGVAYDAGSETNNEDCDFIPGPACNGMGAGVRDTSGAEGFVHVHAGVNGGVDLDATAYDWRNPAALVTVTRVP